MLQTDIIPEYCTADVLVLGCGNVLLGDDGFGPALVEHFEKSYDLPSTVVVRNAHTSVKNLLFDILLTDVRPRLIIIADAVDKDRRPGEVFEIKIDQIPFLKKDDFSMHQMPTSDLLAEIQGTGKVKIRVLACQVECIPEEVDRGLTPVVENALVEAGEIIYQWVSSEVEGL